MKTLFNLLFTKYSSLIILATILLIGCKKKEQHENIPYEYVQQVIKKDMTDKIRNVILIPVNVCSNCIEAAFDLATSFRENDNVLTIIIADYSKQLMPYKAVVERNTFFLDLNLTYKEYGLQLQEPLLLRYDKKGKQLLAKGINLKNLNTLKNEI